MKKWYEEAYRRSLIDMHIEEWDDVFLSEFSAEKYYNCLVEGKINSAMIYLQSHTGLCNFKTEVAKTHNAFCKENKISQLIDKCKNGGINVVGYYSLIFNNWAEAHHPQWAIRYKDGQTWKDKGQRYGLCCPNNTEYRNFVVEQIKEIAAEFSNLDCIYYDMPYWEVLCHCESCSKRFESETGKKITDSEDFRNEDFIEYLQKRQEWMVDFCDFVKRQTNKYLPNVEVCFNFAAVMGLDWMGGSTDGINKSSAWTGGDLYGEMYYHSFCCKYYMNITNNKPFEYQTCRCDRNLREHTIIKSENYLLNEVMLTAAHHGASLVIDAIDPKGSIDERVYKRIGKVFDKQIPLEKYFVGDYCSDVAVFFDDKSQYSSHGYRFFNKTCGIQAVRKLVGNHIPVSVVGNGNFKKIYDYKLIIAPALENISQQRRDDLINYVEQGGNLYLSSTSDTALMKTFFNADFKGYTVEEKTYIRPKKSLYEFTNDYPLPLNYDLPLYSVNGKNCACAYISLPYTDPKNNMKYASIHSNPPGKKTLSPSVMITEFGKGKVLWCAAALEFDQREAFGKTFILLLSKLLDFKKSNIKIDTSSYVEATYFKQDNNFIFHLVDLNFYNETVQRYYSIELKNVAVVNVKEIPSNKDVSCVVKNGICTIKGKFKKYINLSVETKA